MIIWGNNINIWKLCNCWSIWDDDNGNNSGSAYVFEKIDDTWTETAKLTASDGAANDYFSDSVSISEDCVIVGAMWDDDNGNSSGSAYYFDLNPTSTPSPTPTFPIVYDFEGDDDSWTTGGRGCFPIAALPL